MTRRGASAAEQGWQERPGLARIIRIGAFIVPFMASIVTGIGLTQLLPEPATTTWGVFRWIVVAIMSTTVLVSVERVARRVIPLSTLFKLSLAFPDEVPSRLGLALRIGTTTQLAKRIAERSTGPENEPPGEAAHRLLELVGLLSRHDRLTRGHSERVRGYTHLLGAEMGITGKELDRLRWAALLHDIGKIDIPGEILNKPGRLTDDEFDVIKSHPLAGKAYVEPLADWLGTSVRAVWEHHERFDGNGYPMGKARSEIALASRIVSVADAYDVMTSARSYKEPMTGTAARAELSKNAGTQFDPDVVRAFLNLSLGATSPMSRPSRWISQAMLFPQAIVAQASATVIPAVAVGAAAMIGATGLAVGASAPIGQPTLGPDDESVKVADGVDDGPEVSRPEPTSPSNDLGAPSPPLAVMPTTTIATDGDPATTSSGTDNGGTIAAPRPPSTSPESETTVPAPPPTSPPPTSPNTTQPDVTVPDVTVPEVTVVTLPDVTLPVVTVPVVTLPVVTVPVVTVPVVTVPVVTVPVVTLPVVTVPDISLPTGTLPLPDISVPPISVSPISVPPVSVPSVSVPPVSVPPISVPPISVPPVTLPDVTLPRVTLPDLGF